MSNIVFAFLSSTERFAGLVALSMVVLLIGSAVTLAMPFSVISADALIAMGMIWAGLFGYDAEHLRQLEMRCNPPQRAATASALTGLRAVISDLARAVRLPAQDAYVGGYNMRNA